MKMLLATAALVTLFASDALAQSRWRGAYRSYGLWRGPGQAYALAPFPARNMPSSLARNSEQNDTNRGNPPRAISIRMHDV
jgi:hypothetical protein